MGVPGLTRLLGSLGTRAADAMRLRRRTQSMPSSLTAERTERMPAPADDRPAEDLDPDPWTP